MPSVLRSIVAVVAGLVVGGVVNMALVTIGPTIVPTPAGVDVTDAQSLRRTAHLLQARHFVFPFLAHALGTLAGSLTAFLVAANRRLVPAYAVGVLFLAGGIAAATMIPAPAWFLVLDLGGAYIPMAWLATLLGRRLRPAG